MLSSFQCSLIRVTSGTAGPRFWKISVDNFRSICFEGVDVIKSASGEGLWIYTCAGIGVGRAVSGECHRSGPLTLRFLHTDPSTLFPYVSCLPGYKTLGPPACPAPPSGPATLCGQCWGRSTPKGNLGFLGGRGIPWMCLSPPLLLPWGILCLSHPPCGSPPQKAQSR